MGKGKAKNAGNRGKQVKNAKKAVKPAVKAGAKKSVAAKPSKPVKAMAAKVVKSQTSIHHISPVRSRVVIRREQSEEKTAGGLFIPDSAKDKPLSGRVVAVGTGVFSKKGNKRPLQVKVGDKVLFNRYTGSQIELNGEELLVVEEAEILGIIQD